MDTDSYGGSSSSSSSSSTTTASGIQAVQGFSFAIGGSVTNSSKVSGWPSKSSVNEMLQVILENGECLARTTHRGQNHPCQTETLRVDHQGSSGGGHYANTQMQKGGRTSYKRKQNESTSLTEVHIHYDCFLLPNVTQALKVAHDYSYSNVKIVTITAAANAPVNNNNNNNVKRLHCGHCDAAIGFAIPISFGTTRRCPSCGEDMSTNWSFR